MDGLEYGIGDNQFVRLNANGPDANGSSQEARQGWSIYTQASVQAGPPQVLIQERSFLRILRIGTDILTSKTTR
jgi:hypothetical protein